MKKERLDTLLVEKGFFETRSRAQAAIMAGQVLVNEQKIDKTGTQVAPDAAIRILGSDLKYVSRGGLKLEKAVACFDLDLTGKVVSDIGASTGGFTDCALQNGAARVYAIDVGYGQLAWKLRSDERVVNMERTNVRYLEADSLPEKVDVATIDVAFISLDKVLPAVKKILADDGIVIALIKPQFEAGKENVGKKGVVRDPAVHLNVMGKENVGKKGVVRDPAVHLNVINNVIAVAKELDFKISGLDYSPVKGPEGNIEYLLYLKNGADVEDVEINPEEIVKNSHLTLDTGAK